jgi:hypothetical protein
MILNKAYKMIFGKEPENLEEWQIAKEVIDNWNVPLLGEEMAKEVIFMIVNHTNFPSQELTREVVLKAENFAMELFDELKMDEPHMADIERLEFEYNQRKEKKEEFKLPKII